MKRSFLALSTAVFCLLTPSYVSAHCQLPCGIYHDDRVFEELDEHLETLYKIQDEMNKEGAPHYHLVRCVLLQEEVVEKITQTMSQYFLQQRIKTDDAEVSKKVIAVHKIMVAAMKVKQKGDKPSLDELHDLLDAFEDIYSPKK